MFGAMKAFCSRSGFHFYAAVLVAGALVIAACAGTEIRERGPDIRGRVVGVIPAPERMRHENLTGFFKIENGDGRYDHAAITVTDSTTITRSAGGARSAATFGDIATGDSVEVVFIGPVLESYPVQGTARSVLILSR